MSENSAIEWTDHTFNAWWGCTKVSEGCTHCYADTLSTRYGFNVWGPKADRRFFGDKHWQEPLKWNRDAEKAGERRRVFCSSMADVFERHMVAATDTKMQEARDRLWELIDQTPMLDWLLLTKRPENIRMMVPWEFWVRPRSNVWYGTSVENQEQADRRIPQLLQVPAVVRFLSCEPLLGTVNLALEDMFCEVDKDLVHTCATAQGGWNKACRPGIHWVIAGGESGPGARPMHPDWARSLRDQCNAAGVAFHFKQWGEWAPVYSAGDDPDGIHSVQALPDGTVTDTDWNGGAGPHLTFAKPMWRYGKKKAGRELDGRTWDEFPEVLV